jgi:hypothetical protein
VVWDVISFWPRSAHPFVPAAYSQRAVPDLECLIRTRLADDPRAELVLCGHSQGSLLSFAALLRLQSVDQDPGSTGPRLLPRIGLLTFGSQLQVMFSRAFPAYVNHDAITHLYTALGGRWRNLYRDTDHLAGPVLSWSHDRVEDTAERIDAVGALPSTRTADREEHGPDWRLVDPPMPACADLNRAALLPLRRHSDYWLDAAWTPALCAVRGVHAGRSAQPVEADDDAGEASAICSTRSVDGRVPTGPELTLGRVDHRATGARGSMPPTGSLPAVTARPSTRISESVHRAEDDDRRLELT